MALWSGLFARPAQIPVYTRPSLTLFFLMSGAFLLTLVPHIVQFPPWLTVAIVAAIVLRSVLEVYRLPLPSSTFCGILAVIFFAAVWWQFGRISGREAGTALTAGLLAIKFYELRRPRDVALIIFSCYFMVMSALLYSQVLELFVYCLIMMWVLTALLLRVHTGDLAYDRLLRMLSQSGTIFLQALPFALFLFFFFPRFTGKLSLLLSDASIGLTDTVSPGSIAKLAQDDSVAMYVRFISPVIPNADTTYWRAMVLWSYKNGTWTAGERAPFEMQTKPPDTFSGTVEQEITVTPHNQRWLFALDAPISVPIDKSELKSWAMMLNGNVIQMAFGTKLDHLTRYTVSSAIYLPETELSNGERESGTQLPADQIDPDVLKLADQLHQGLSSGQEIEYIGRVLYYFRHSGFVYTTAPGIQGPDWLSDFLLRSKSGFCEHFASAFAVLMRLEHVPARLVVGYLGYDYNPYTDHYIVSQSNAHAWDEVWISSRKRWIRVDPTAEAPVAADVLQAGNANDAGDTLSSQLGRHQRTFAETYLPDWVNRGLKEFALRRDQVETGWDNIVLSYDPEVQSRWAQALGFGQKSQVNLLMVCFVAGGLCLIVFQHWVTRKPHASPVENLYTAFCRNMAQRGLPRATWEGPLAYTERVAESFPDDKATIQRVGSIVAHARYGPAPPDPATPDNLKSLLTLLTASQAASTSRERS